VLVNAGWDGSPLSAVTWTVVMIGVAATLSLLLSYRHRDLAYSGVIVWALVGILLKQMAYAPIVAACGIAIGAIALGTMAFQWRKPPMALEMAK
jgi:hypothetical protein